MCLPESQKARNYCSPQGRWPFRNSFFSHELGHACTHTQSGSRTQTVVSHMEVEHLNHSACWFQGGCFLFFLLGAYAHCTKLKKIKNYWPPLSHPLKGLIMRISWDACKYLAVVWAMALAHGKQEGTFLSKCWLLII